MDAKRLVSGIVALTAVSITACGGTAGDEPAEPAALPGEALVVVETVRLDVEGMT